MTKPATVYNSRILKFYVAYLNARHPQVDLDEILTAARITKYQLADPGYWCDQEQADLFHEKAKALSGNPDIAREVGRHAALTDAAGPIRQHVLGLLNTASIYLLLAKLYPMLSRGARVKVRKIGANKVEILSVPSTGVQERPYQCDNRLGVFESLAALFTGKYAQIEHDQCIHRGDPYCRYTVSWEVQRHQKWKWVLKAGAVIGAIGVVAGFFIWPTNVWWAVNAALAIALMAICLRIGYLERQDLIRTIQKQGNAAEDHIKEIDYRYRGALLVQKIGQATSVLLDVNELAQVVMTHIQDQLDFDRGIVMLADESRRRLIFAAGFGFDADKTELLHKTRFRLDHPDAKGLFVQVFRDQRPVLLDDVDTIKDSFSARSRLFAREIGSQSLICLPIVYENHSLGILAVDNIHTKRSLTQSDVNLLLGVAYQTAVSISSALSYKKLQDSETRYRSLYENAPTAYCTISLEEAVILKCNRAASELLGLARRRLIGTRWLDCVASDRGSQTRAKWIQEALQHGRAVYNEELQLQHADGRIVWANVSMEPFRTPQGAIAEGRCVLVDITERKRLEEKLRHAQKMEAMGTLAGGVAHDLSNILSAIVSYPDLLLMDIPKESNLYGPLTKIKMAGARAAAIVQDLLTLARRGVQLKEVIDLNQVVEEFLASPEHDNLKRHHPRVDIIPQLAESLPAIRGSRAHLVKMIMNLVLNAAEAMPQGGHVLIVSELQQQKEGEGRKERPAEAYVVVSVIDNGTGIPEEDISRIFEPFYTKKVMGRSGTGLGMAIVWATMQDHEGFVRVHSTMGKGTVVRLFFPATNEVQAPIPSVPRIEDLMGCGETILVVDDEVEHRHIACEMLKRLNYQVSAADSGQAALIQMAKASPSLVLLDMALGEGDMDGLILYQRMLALNPGQKAVIVSGYDASARVKKVLGLGAADYVHKPYTLRQIAAAVKSALDKK